MELIVTPYRICTSIFIKIYCIHRTILAPKENGKICLFILDVIRQNEYPYNELLEMIEDRCDGIMVGQFRKTVENTIADINDLFELVKQIRESSNADNNSVAGLYLRKMTIYFERLTHQACSQLFDNLKSYVSNTGLTGYRHRGPSAAWRTPRTTRSSNIQQNQTPRDTELASKNQHPTGARQIYRVSHEISRLQANDGRAMSPKEIYEALRRPNETLKKDATFLRYLNLLRVNEAVGSKHLLLAYFDMVSDSVPRSYSALNYAIWYSHHGEYKRAIECLQECFCCAQAADDDKCLLTSLMWLARILIQANQENSSKYHVRALLELVRKRSHKAGMAYVQAMSSLTLEQLKGPIDDSENLKKCSGTLKQIAQCSRQQNLLLASNHTNPLDEDDGPPSAEILAVRNSMNDVLAMYYALLSAHLNLMNDNQTSALASQTLLHFDLIEKCGNDDVLLMNENTFIAVRNLAHHVWNSTRDIQLVREILVDLCMNKIAKHRTDSQSIWRQAYSEISFEYHVEQENWSEATKMISVINETDQDGAQLRQAELLQLMGDNDEALHQVDDLIKRIELEECNPMDPAVNTQDDAPVHNSPSVENRSFIKSKALLLRAKLLGDEIEFLRCLQYAIDHGFIQTKTACMRQLELLRCCK